MSISPGKINEEYLENSFMVCNRTLNSLLRVNFLCPGEQKCAVPCFLTV